MCRVEGSEGGKWDNCNSIINKIYFFKKEATEYAKHLTESVKEAKEKCQEQIAKRHGRLL